MVGGRRVVLPKQSGAGLRPRLPRALMVCRGRTAWVRPAAISAALPHRAGLLGVFGLHACGPVPVVDLCRTTNSVWLRTGCHPPDARPVRARAAIHLLAAFDWAAIVCTGSKGIGCCAPAHGVPVQCVSGTGLVAGVAAAAGQPAHARSWGIDAAGNRRIHIRHARLAGLARGMGAARALWHAIIAGNSRIRKLVLARRPHSAPLGA